MLRGIWGDPERYKETYWSRFGGQYYFAGDGAKNDADGNIWLLGRVDDVMNVSGHRLSTTEIESALVSHPKVAEAAVVGANDETTGQAVVRVRHPAQEAVEEADEPGEGKELVQELRNHVAKEIGPIAKPRSDHDRQRAAEDPLRQDHAPPAARRRREPRGRRRDDPGRLARSWTSSRRAWRHPPRTELLLLDAVSADPDPGQVGGAAEREGLGQRVVGVAGVPQGHVEGACRARGAATARRTALPTAKSPTSSARPSASRARAVARWSRWPRSSGSALAAEQLLHEVGLQPLLEQREPGAGADVGAQRDADAEREVRAAAGTARCPGRSCWWGSARPRRRGGRAAAAPRRWGARCARARCAARPARAGRRWSM